jgi:hypothetical protein
MIAADRVVMDDGAARERSWYAVTSKKKATGDAVVREETIRHHQ